MNPVGRGPDESPSLAWLQSGRAVLEAHRPEAALPLRPWRGREGELLERMDRTARGEEAGLSREVAEATRQACQVGATLGREQAADKLRIPGGLKPLEADLQKTAARLQAFGQANPFRTDTLKAVAPGMLKAALEEVRKGGLLSEGPEWALCQEQAPNLSISLQRTLQRQLELDRQLADPAFVVTRGAR